eukprot:scaffold112346_cov36-Phaeocystis_antarctica.AAC.1
MLEGAVPAAASCRANAAAAACLRHAWASGRPISGSSAGTRNAQTGERAECVFILLLASGTNLANVWRWDGLANSLVATERQRSTVRQRRR